MTKEQKALGIDPPDLTENEQSIEENIARKKGCQCHI